MNLPSRLLFPPDACQLSRCFEPEQKDEDLELVWPIVKKAVDAALLQCDTMRLQEGNALAIDSPTAFIPLPAR